MKKRAVIYTRVSGKKQVDEGLSLENQSERLIKYCDFEDFEIIEQLEDAGISGRGTKNRPGFNRVMELVNTNQVDAVIVYSLSRFARNTRATLEALDSMVKSNVSFHSLSERISTDSAMGKFFVTVMAALCELESGQISERVSSIKSMQKSKGESYSANIYGFDRNNSGCIVNKNEMKIVRQIISMKKEMSYAKVAEYLNDSEVKTKNGGSWHPVTVEKIVKRESFYKNHL